MFRLRLDGFSALLSASILVALVPTVWPSLDVAVADYFFQAASSWQPAAWPWVLAVNRYVPLVFRCVLLLSLLVIVYKVWRHAPDRKAWAFPAFILAAGLMGPGLVINGVVKTGWERARPYQVQRFGGERSFSRAGVPADECEQNCSFVSGHVACGFFIASLMLVDRKRRGLWVVAGTLAGLTIGFCRMAAMDHWLSDVLWAYPVTLLSSLLVYVFTRRYLIPQVAQSTPSV